jgi:hypothetical protein
MYNVYLNYGYETQEHLATSDTLSEARIYFEAYTLDYAEEGETVEIISFADNGEAVTHRRYDK